MSKPAKLFAVWRSHAWNCLCICCAGPDKDDQRQQRVQCSQQGTAVRWPPSSGEGACPGASGPKAEGQAGQSSRQGAELARGRSAGLIGVPGRAVCLCLRFEVSKLGSECSTSWLQ